MRFNDFLDTILAARGEGPSGAITRWRQCIDMLAQMPVGTREFSDEMQVARLFSSLDTVRHHVPVEQRITSVQELGGWLRSPILVRFLSADHPSVCSEAMNRARLSDSDWASLIPIVGPLARSILRNRTDLGSQARVALDAFGKVDMTIGTSVVVAAEDALELAPTQPAQMDELSTAQIAEPTYSSVATSGVAYRSIISTIAAVVANDSDDLPAPSLPVQLFEQPDVPVVATFEGAGEGTDEEAVDDVRPATCAQDEATPMAEIESEISRIVDRIEAFRMQRPLGVIGRAKAHEATLRFQFEADESGIIRAVAGAPRSASIGLSISAAALDGRSGADGHALGAFRRRAALKDARYIIGEGHLAGEWRLTAEPVFSVSDGRFQGYVGEARRALAHELSVRSREPEAEIGALSAANTRQLVHELRTPLNAIQGFAEIIEQQMFGPVSSSYRDMAAQILNDARRLVATFDDLDLASRLVRGDGVPHVGQHAIGPLIDHAISTFRQDGDGRQAILVNSAEDLPMVKVDAGLVERLFMHLFRALTALREPDEILLTDVTYRADAAMVDISVILPSQMNAWSQEAFYNDSAQIVSDEGEGPPLGSAFSLKLVRTLTASCGGAFTAEGGRCHVSLPAAARGSAGDSDYMRNA